MSVNLQFEYVYNYYTECDSHTLHTRIHTFRVMLYSLCGARSGSPQLQLLAIVNCHRGIEKIWPKYHVSSKTKGLILHSIDLLNKKQI